MDTQQLWAQADVIGRAVALLLLLMSVCSWALIGWKFMALRQQVASLDNDQLLLPLIDAAQQALPQGSLASQLPAAARLTRPLRDALHAVMARLQWGQVMLASIGATAPFVGLLGTVWGIYQALHGLGGGGALSIERIAGPVGEALVMTAAGLVVAIPAVLAYNAFNHRVAACESELEGFAHDLRAALE
jgi:biopolymer transport protein ExbB